MKNSVLYSIIIVCLSILLSACEEPPFVENSFQKNTVPLYSGFYIDGTIQDLDKQMSIEIDYLELSSLDTMMFGYTKYKTEQETSNILIFSYTGLIPTQYGVNPARADALQGTNQGIGAKIATDRQGNSELFASNEENSLSRSELLELLPIGQTLTFGKLPGQVEIGLQYRQTDTSASSEDSLHPEEDTFEILSVEDLAEEDQVEVNLATGLLVKAKINCSLGNIRLEDTEVLFFFEYFE